MQGKMIDKWRAIGLTVSSLMFCCAIFAGNTKKLQPHNMALSRTRTTLLSRFTIVDFWVTIRSIISTFFLYWPAIRKHCPAAFRRLLERHTTWLTRIIDPYIQITVHEFIGSYLTRSGAYAAVEAYLSEFSSTKSNKLEARMGKEPNKLSLTMDDFEEVYDEFRGVKVWWILSKTQSSNQTSMSCNRYNADPVRRCYRLTFHQKHKKMIMDDYLEHVVTTGKENLRKKRQKLLYMNNPNNGSRRLWSPIVFNHPATFETLAMESEKKQEIVKDLQAFKESKDYYARIGKTWKRGYLLYGPPGTGKSTMIAAMANLLEYDVYDLELTAVEDNTELKQLLIETTSRSIIVIEDIDCSLDIAGQRKDVKTASKEPPNEGGVNSEVTLSGLLNFIDGLWSSCGGERIIVFTTNHVEKLDPALTRRGRMDKHIELSYCSFEGFKILAKNYLNLEMHPMFEEIEDLMEMAKITPADVAEKLMPISNLIDADKCLSNLVQSLREKKEAKEATQLKN